MFDIGFTELVIIAVIGLLVIGPERLPGAIRTGSAWIHRIKRGFNDIRQEVSQELHNDAVLQELRKTGADLQASAREAERELRDTVKAADPEGTEDTKGTEDTQKPASSQEPPAP